VTELVLVRHAAHDRVGSTLCGRMPGVVLGEEGRRQAAALAGRLADAGAAAVLSSPLERARETAAPIAARLGLEARPDADFVEIDFGDWTGRRFDSLAGSPDWDAWNSRRGTARPPGGEAMAAVRDRAWAGMERARAGHPDGRVIVVSHCDVIKAAIAALLGLPLDHLGRFDVAPASISTVHLWPGGGRVTGINEVVRA